MAKAAYPTIGIAAFVMFVIVYFIGCLPLSYDYTGRYYPLIAGNSRYYQLLAATTRYYFGNGG